MKYIFGLTLISLFFPIDATIIKSANFDQAAPRINLASDILDNSDRIRLAQTSEQQADRDFWKSIEGSNNIEDYKSYLEWFPNGRFISRAKSEIERLKGEKQTEPSQSASIDTFKDCDVCPEMVVIPPGSFMLGAEHEVTIRKPFAAGMYEVTVDQFLAFADETGHSTGNICYGFVYEARIPGEPKSWLHRDRFSFRNPGFAQTGSHPVTCVSWKDAKKYVKWLSRKTRKKYRLLTEAEWEYAARGGTSTVYWWGNEAKKKYANWNYDNQTLAQHHGTTPVGSFPPNNFGLYDVIGNVLEWVEDCWHDDFSRAPRNGSAWLKANRGDCGRRVMRSGSWKSEYFNASIVSRGTLASFERDNRMGFRVARSLEK